MLPLANVTAELLARWLGRQLIDALGETMDFAASAVRVELQEMDGHTALFDWRPD